jgi:deazaflavin-dependent oxidoreductase (nitroreductase family)
VALAYDPPVRRLLVKLAASRAGAFWFLRIANPIDKRLLPATNGRLSTAPGQPVCVIETVGARSGERRRIPLQFASDGEDVILIGSAGGAPKHPAWVHNLRKNPDVRVWANRGRSGHYVAHETSGEERARLWKIACRLYPGYETYQGRAGAREIPVFKLSPRRA